MRKAVECGRADIAADHAVLVDKKRCVNGPVVIRIVFNRIGITHDRFPAITLQIQPLRLLNGIVILIDGIKPRGDHDRLLFGSSFIDLPAEAGKKRTARFR